MEFSAFSKLSLNFVFLFIVSAVAPPPPMEGMGVTPSPECEAFKEKMKTCVNAELEKIESNLTLDSIHSAKKERMTTCLTSECNGQAPPEGERHDFQHKIEFFQYIMQCGKGFQIIHTCHQTVKTQLQSKFPVEREDIRKFFHQCEETEQRPQNCPRPHHHHGPGFSGHFGGPNGPMGQGGPIGQMGSMGQMGPMGQNYPGQAMGPMGQNFQGQGFPMGPGPVMNYPGSGMNGQFQGNFLPNFGGIRRQMAAQGQAQSSESLENSLESNSNEADGDSSESDTVSNFLDLQL